jgi:hypothetical protein
MRVPHSGHLLVLSDPFFLFLFDMFVAVAFFWLPELWCCGAVPRARVAARDLTRAVALYERAAASGSALAQFKLGCLLLNGEEAPAEGSSATRNATANSLASAKINAMGAGQTRAQTSFSRDRASSSSGGDKQRGTVKDGSVRKGVGLLQ